MGYTLQITKTEQVTLSAETVDRLVSSGNGDAALLYLCLLRHNGQLEADEALRKLHFSVERRTEAEETLQKLGLLGEKLPSPEEAQSEACPSYSQSDVAEALERDTKFFTLQKEVARKLNKLSLTTVENQSLLTLYSFLSLPPDVIFTLVSHCIAQSEKRYGVGRRPTMRQIEKEGFNWHRRGIDTARRANEYIKNVNKRQSAFPQYMEVLQLGGRPIAPSEEKYLTEWVEMGFLPEAVAIAYDRTMLKCHELRWGYLTGILRRWHGHGVHSVEEIRAEEKPKKAAAPAAAKGGKDWSELMDDVRRLDED